MVDWPKAWPVNSIFSAGLASEHVALQRWPGCAPGGSRYEDAGHVMVDVVVEPAMDSSVTSFGTVSAPSGVLQKVVVSVCCVIGTQLTVAQRPSATIIEVLDGKVRATPTRFKLSPPVVRYV
jgi:hypothetical protein